jgi:hypothetical protein
MFSNSMMLPRGNVVCASLSHTSSGVTDYEVLASPSNQMLQAPTSQMLLAMTHLPGGRPKRKSSKKSQPGALVHEGQICSKFFNALGNRPRPMNGLSLEQSITMEAEFIVSNYAISSGTAGVIAYNSAILTAQNFTSTPTLFTVFDQYRFEQIEAWLEFINPNSASSFPDFVSAVDLDDGNIPTSVGQVIDHQGALVSSGPGGHYHKWKPHVAVAVYSGAFTSFANEEAQWIDSASPAVQHYGLKSAIISNGAATVVNAVFRAVISFRAPSIN